MSRAIPGDSGQIPRASRGPGREERFAAGASPCGRGASVRLTRELSGDDGLPVAAPRPAPPLRDTEVARNRQRSRRRRDRPAAMPHQRDRRIDRSSADLAAGLAEIGLTPKAAWYSAAALWGAAGLLAIGLYVIGAAWFPRDGFYLGCVAVVTAVLSLAGGLWIGDASSITEWTTHARMIAGLALYIAAAAIDPNGVVAFALLPLLSVPNPCYLCTWRLAVPYVVAAASIVYVALILTGGTAHVAHALVSTCAVVAVGAAMIVTRQRTLGLARRNRRLAYTDALTGIANMRRLRERISDGARPPGEDEQPLALFAMDLDNFKQVNDRFDHSTGDRVLCAVAVALDKELDPSDVLVRR